VIRFNERFDGSNVMASHLNGYAYLFKMMLREALVLTSPPIEEELTLDASASVDYGTNTNLGNIYKTANPLVTSIASVQVSTDGVAFEHTNPVDIDWLSGRIQLRPDITKTLGGVEYKYTSEAPLNDGEGYFSYMAETVISGMSQDLSIVPVRSTVTHWEILVDGVVIAGPVPVSESIRVLDAVVEDTSRVTIRLYDSGFRRVKVVYSYVMDIKFGDIDLGTFTVVPIIAGQSADVSVNPTVNGITHWALYIDDVLVDGPRSVSESIRVINQTLSDLSRLSIRFFNTAHLPYMMLTSDIASSHTIGDYNGQTIAQFECAGLYLLKCSLEGTVDYVAGTGSGNLGKEVDYNVTQ